MVECATNIASARRLQLHNACIIECIKLKLIEAPSLRWYSECGKFYLIFCFFYVNKIVKFIDFTVWYVVFAYLLNSIARKISLNCERNRLSLSFLRVNIFVANQEMSFYFIIVLWLFLSHISILFGSDNLKNLDTLNSSSTRITSLSL